MISCRPPRHRAATAAGNASPAAISAVTVGIDVSGGSVSSTLGGSVTWVTRSAVNAAANAPPIRVSASPSTRQAPEPSVITTSEIEASKLADAHCRTRLPGSTANAAIWVRARFPIPRCATATPLGTPVDPDV